MVCPRFLGIANRRWHENIERNSPLHKECESFPPDHPLVIVISLQVGGRASTAPSPSPSPQMGEGTRVRRIKNIWLMDLWS